MYDSLEKLTVDELLQKQIEIREKLVKANSTGMSIGIINQLHTMLDYISIEIKSKSESESEAQRKENAITNNEDSDSQVLNIGDVE